MKKIIIALLLTSASNYAQNFHIEQFELKNAKVAKIIETNYSFSSKITASQDSYEFDAKGYVSKLTHNSSLFTDISRTSYIYIEDYSELTKQLLDEMGNPIKFFGKSGPFKIYATKIGYQFDYNRADKNSNGEISKLYYDKYKIEKVFDYKKKYTTCQVTENGIIKPMEYYTLDKKLMCKTKFGRYEDIYTYEGAILKTHVVSSYTNFMYKYIFEFDTAGNWIKKITFSSNKQDKYQWKLFTITNREITYTDNTLNIKKPTEVLNTLKVADFEAIRKSYEARYKPTEVITDETFKQKVQEITKLMQQLNN